MKKSRRIGEYTDELIVSSRETGKTVARSTVKLGLCNALRIMETDGYIKGPKQLNVPDAHSYLYAIFLNRGIIKEREQ